MKSAKDHAHSQDNVESMDTFLQKADEVLERCDPGVPVICDSVLQSTPTVEASPCSPSPESMMPPEVSKAQQYMGVSEKCVR